MILPFICSVFYLLSISSSLNSDGLSLLALKAAITTDPTRVLASWTELDSDPCLWVGIGCDSDHRVTSISLSGKGLTGYLPSELGALLSLQVLSLSRNNFSKLIPVHLFNANNLTFLDLSYNSLTGTLPEKITNLESLTHLDLSSNSLTGSLPEDLSNLTHLSGTLNLSYNQFSGEIPFSFGFFPVMVSLDLRHNNLAGKIPQVGSLLNQGPTAFTGNPSLCGFPLQNPCPDPEAQNPRIQPDPENPLQPNSSNGYSNKQKSKPGSVLFPLITAVFVLGGVILISIWVIKKKQRNVKGKIGKEKVESEVSEEGQKGKFVVIDEGFGMELEDLLRASAYVVGKSRSGIVYKVVVGRGGSGAAAGAAVAVRRLSEGDVTWRFKEFETEVEAIAKVHHPNIVRLRAYYYAHDEKLLVSDFIGNGSLYSALHGCPANSLPPLTWATRLRIVQATARALTCIHEYGPRKYAHGNIKSSKILLDENLQPFLTGFGLTRLISSTSRSSKSGPNTTQILVSPKSSSASAYTAPEARSSGSKVSQKCDVYSFGILLMEILSGRVADPSQDDEGKGLESIVRRVFREERPLSEIIDEVVLHEVHAKVQVVTAFHIALNCTEVDPDLRPRMRMVSDSLDRIKLL